MEPTELSPPTDGRRDWLAALLLRQPDRFLPRLTATLTRWRATPRAVRRRWQRRVAATAAGAALLLAMTASPLLVPTARAATITVDGTCTLIEAIVAANTDMVSGSCIAGSPGADTIDLQVDVTLTASIVNFAGPTGTPPVTSEIVIEGNGHTIARDVTAPEFRILAVISTGDLTLNDVTISGGRFATTYADGTGILVYNGRLGVYDSTITDNAVVTYGFGGGIANAGGDVTIVRSTISDNHAGNEGGGLSQIHGTATIHDSTFTGNSAGDDGGAIVHYYGTMSIVNSTLSGNSAGSGGAIYADDPLTIVNSTVTGNAAGSGGAIFTFDPVTLSRSIISGNSTTGTGAEIINFSTISADDSNIFGHAGLNNVQAFYGFTPGASDVNATSDGDNIPLADILDTTLDDNGGPTATHNLVADSPAVDLADDAACAAPPVNGLDQRGAPRPFDVAGQGNDGADTCDAGAVEFLSPVPGGIDVFMSAATAGTTADGLKFGPHDVLRWDGSSWSKFFDGSAAGLTPNGRAKHNINALWVPDPNEEDVVLSFGQNARFVGNITPKVDGMDLVWWDADAEEFSLWFDGDDVDLTSKTQEKIDALHVLPGSESPIGGGSCQAYLLISTQGPGRVSNQGQPAIIFSGEDVLGFCATNLGDNTDGLWTMVIDGSDQGMPRNSTTSISVSEDGNTLYLTTRSTFNVDAATGGHSMVFAYDFGTETFSGPYFVAADAGLTRHVNALHVGELAD